MSNELVKQISYILYNEPEEDVKINAVIKDETIWLTQKAMAELFDCSTDTIGLHLKIFFQMKNWQKIQLPRKSRQLKQYLSYPIILDNSNIGAYNVRKQNRRNWYLSDR